MFYLRYSSVFTCRGAVCLNAQVPGKGRAPEYKLGKSMLNEHF